jgi:hypothetical protein
MPDYRAMTRDAARRYGLDPGVFMRQIQQESGFNPTVRSPAGAVGIAQIMPATARGWGVNPLDPEASLNAAAKNMASYVKRYGGIENALRAYNAGPGAIQASKGYAETNNYVKTILGGSAPSGPRSSAPRSSAPNVSADPSAAQALLALAAPKRQALQITAPTAPSFAAQAPTAGTATLPQTAAAPKPRLDIGKAVEAITALQPQPQSSVGTGRDSSRTSASRPSGGKGNFKISGPDPGRLQPGLVKFAGRVADTLGASLIGLDGSTHSKMTTNGRVSDHYTGNATDIFTVNGKSLKQHPGLLIQAGRAALVAAGMDPRKARKAGIGLYNVNGHQIIFGTNSRALGGDHTDHLHISAR